MKSINYMPPCDRRQILSNWVLTKPDSMWETDNVSQYLPGPHPLKLSSGSQNPVLLIFFILLCVDGSQYDLFPQSASCKCYFFDNLGRLSPKCLGEGCDKRFNDVLRRRFLRQGYVGIYCYMMKCFLIFYLCDDCWLKLSTFYFYSTVKGEKAKKNWWFNKATMSLWYFLSIVLF